MKPKSKVECIVIGCSAGGIDSLSKIFKALPKNFSIPIVVVIHIAADAGPFFQDCFAGSTTLKIKEADEKEILQGGFIYFAPPDHHLLIEIDKSLSLSREEPLNYSRPSIDLLFTSAADCFGEGLLAVILTGANEDGAAGAKYVESKGGLIVVENPKTAKFAKMPEATISLVVNVLVKDADTIAKFIAELV